MIIKSTIEELDVKMLKIASSHGMDIDSFKKLPRKEFIAKCNEYNNKNKNKWHI
jgi:hypothetical protein